MTPQRYAETRWSLYCAALKPNSMPGKRVPRQIEFVVEMEEDVEWHTGGATVGLETSASLPRSGLGIVWRTVDGTGVLTFLRRRRKRLCNRILTLLDGKDRTMKITQAQVEPTRVPHMQCISVSAPCFFLEPIARSLNSFFNEGE